ncbi:MAG: LysM domain-containing protein, partial [Candidatus Methylomirabilales bacterium]
RADAGPARGNRIVRHRVGKGESLGGIARMYGVALEDLRQWNRLGKKTGLRLGQVLRVAPPERRGEPAPRTPSVARR